MNAKKRQFPLQAVLDYRVHVEEEARRAVAELLRAESAHDSAIVRCERAAMEHMRMLHAGGTLKIAEARACEFQLAALQRSTSRLVAETGELRAALDLAQHDAVEAGRDRRAIETLRGRHLAAFAAAQRRIEEEDIAEIDALRERS